MRRPLSVALAVLSLALTIPTAATAARRGPSETTYVVTSAADSGPGTLRQALLDANAAAATHATIAFDLPGASPHRVAPVTNLPSATSPVTIDGTTQPGYDGAPVVELRGTDGVSIGLELLGGSTVRGLVVSGFSQTGVRLAGGSNVVEGCYVGTDAAGTSAVPNGQTGVESSGYDRIGGTEPGAGNLISGNGAVPNVSGAVYVFGPNVTIQGNRIGTDASGTAPLGNDGPGVRIRGATGVLVGGVDRAAANVIAFNGGPGVVTRIGFGDSVLGNAIYANGERFVTNFDGYYGIHDDTGAQAPPATIVLVDQGADSTRVKGAVTYQPSTLYGFGAVRFELFRNVDCSREGYGQGKEFLGAVEGTRGPDGYVTFETELPVTLGPGETITCTATAPDGSTSPFSNCASDTSGCELPFLTNDSATTYVESGGDATFEAEATGTGPISYQWYARDENLEFVAVPGATSATFTARRVAKSTDFEVVATNACGSAFGYYAASACRGAPSIEAQPADVTVVRGKTAFVVVTIPFGDQAKYRWYRGQRGDTSHPVDSPYATFRNLAFLSAEASGTYWCRLTNACGTTDSEAATITVVDAMTISSVAVKGSGAKAKIVATGTSIPADVIVFVPAGANGVGFVKPAKVSGGRKVTQRGETLDGRSIDEAVPPGATTTVYFSGSRGFVTAEVTRP